MSHTLIHHPRKVTGLQSGWEMITLNLYSNTKSYRQSRAQVCTSPLSYICGKQNSYDYCHSHYLKSYYDILMCPPRGTIIFYLAESEQTFIYKERTKSTIGRGESYLGRFTNRVDSETLFLVCLLRGKEWQKRRGEKTHWLWHQEVCLIKPYCEVSSLNKVNWYGPKTLPIHSRLMSDI